MGTRFQSKLVTPLKLLFNTAIVDQNGDFPENGFKSTYPFVVKIASRNASSLNSLPHLIRRPSFLPYGDYGMPFQSSLAE